MEVIHALLVEDEPHLSKHLASRLQGANMNVKPFSSLEGLDLYTPISDEKIDVIILDRMLNGRDSAEKIDDLRQRYPMTRIIIISAINSTGEKVELLNRGVDDYLSKPFESEELIARIRAVVRRGESGHSLVYKDLTMRFADRSLMVGEDFVAIPNKEFILLKTLIAVPGRIVSKPDLQKAVWANDPEVDSNVVEVTIGKLRKRLKELNSIVVIRNSRSVGYWIEV